AAKFSISDILSAKMPCLSSPTSRKSSISSLPFPTAPFPWLPPWLAAYYPGLAAGFDAVNMRPPTGKRIFH
uniref:Uncharacterized protein n=1 Tax=Plectus sambesii TaxID=2011161 RepID=A0A914V619_9BILA